jgi:thiamine kinase-like enzyme
MQFNLEMVKKEIENQSFEIFNKNKVICKNIKRLPLSKKNINYFFQINTKKYILRINIDGLNRNNFKKSKTEYNSLKILDKYFSSKNYPSVLYFTKKGKHIPYSYIIIDYLEGRKVKITKENTKLIAKELGKLNKIKISFFDKLKIKKQNFKDLDSEFNLKHFSIIDNLPIISNLYKKINKKLILKKPKNINQDLFFTHGDLRIENILKNKNKIYFIDFEYLKLGNPLFDIAKLSHSKNFKKYESIFLKEYTKYVKIKNIYEKYLFCKDYQIYCWLVSSTKYYLNKIFIDFKYKINDRKENIKNIYNNYKYLYNKGYINKEYNIDYLKKNLQI